MAISPNLLAPPPCSRKRKKSLDSTDPMGQVPQTWERMGSEQLRIYARELAETYRKEQQLRQEVEAKNRELEQKLREISALNALFQKHLDLRRQKQEELKGLVDAIYKVGEEAEEIMLRATHILQIEIDRDSLHTT